MGTKDATANESELPLQSFKGQGGLCFRREKNNKVRVVQAALTQDLSLVLHTILEGP